jgi:hypothetical protein
LPGKTLDDAVAQVWKLGNTGLFLQDTFKIRSVADRELAGVRVDSIDMPAPSRKPMPQGGKVDSGGHGCINGSTYTQRQTGGFGMDNTVTPDGNNLVQPRLGFNWNLGSKERRMQLRGGLGLFQGCGGQRLAVQPLFQHRHGRGLLSAAGSSNGADRRQRNNRAACANTATGGVFSPDPRASQPALGTNPAAQRGLPGQRPEHNPRSGSSTLALDAELPWFGLVAGVEWMPHLKVKDGIYYEHLNLGSRPPRKGKRRTRQLFYNANGYDSELLGCHAAGVVFSTAAGCGGSVSNRALNNASVRQRDCWPSPARRAVVGRHSPSALAQQPIPGLRCLASRLHPHQRRPKSAR